MNTIIGLLIIAVGSMGQSSSYVPIKKVKELTCKLFIQGQNVLTFTPYRGGDPEFRFSGFLPPLRVISGGMTLTF